jgi:hypothetical protein
VLPAPTSFDIKKHEYVWMGQVWVLLYMPIN